MSTAAGRAGDGTASTPAPTVSIGLPVYNGERYLAESLEALLAQTYTDFELVLSDNASTDGTEAICREFAARDDRIRYVRQPVNIGAGPNHNFVFDVSRGRFFKWASHDDLYAPELVEKCMQALEEHPEMVLAHSWDAFIDENGDVIRPVPYILDTANRSASARLKSLLYVSGGNDCYGVVRRDAFAAVGGHKSYHNADRVFVAALALQGPFYQVPEILYYRRDHPTRAERSPSKRIRSANLDPKRGDKLRNPMARMYAEYILGYVTAIRRAPISATEKIRSLVAVGGWVLSRMRPGGAKKRLLDSADPAVLARAETKPDTRTRRRAAGTP